MTRTLTQKFKRVFTRPWQFARPQGLLRRLVGKSHRDVPAIPEVWTEYLSWLSFANAGMMDKGNVSCFDYAIRNLPSDAPIVEIGSFCGLSTNTITHLKELHGRSNRLITCDRWLFEGYEPGEMLAGSKSISHDEYRNFVMRTFRQNVEAFSAGDLPYTIEVFSDEFFIAWGDGLLKQDVFGRDVRCGGPISFCYIDGNHTYEVAKRDFQNCAKFLQKGGFVLLDDSGTDSPLESKIVAREILADSRFRLIACNPNYFFQKI